MHPALPWISRLATIVMIATGAVSMTACGENKDVFDLGNQEGDTFSNSNRAERIRSIEEKYEVKILIPNRSYDAEHGTNRVLRFLAENLETYAGQLKASGVVEIEISDRFEAVDVPNSGGKLRLRLNAGASETGIRHYLSHYAEDVQTLNQRTEAARRMGLEHIQDGRGFNASETSEFLARVERAALGLDFQANLPMSFHKRLVIDRVYAIGGATMHVPHDATEEGLRAFFGKSIDLAKHLREDLKNASTAIGVEVDFQKSVLTPDEIMQGIQNLVAHAQAVRSATGTKRSILIGRRTETDAAMIRSQGTLLVSFTVTSEELAAALALLDPDMTQSLQKLLADFKAGYIASGIDVAIELAHFGLPSGIPTAGTVDRVSSVLARLNSVAPAASLARLQVRSLHAATSSSSSSNPAWLEDRGGNHHRLYTRLDSRFSEEAISAALSPHHGRHERTQRLRMQRSMIEHVWAQGSYRNLGVSFDLSDDQIDTSSAENTRILGAFLDTFKRIATAKRLADLQIRTVRFERVQAEREFVVTAGTLLQVDPYQATAAQLEQALFDLENPAPAPSPTARPTPGRPHAPKAW